MRLFFALWPDEAAALALERLSADVVSVAGGKPVPRGKIHLTLAFLGEVEALEAAQAAGAALAAAPMAVRLDCVGSFRRSRVAWAGSLAPDPALDAMQERLAAGLGSRGFALEHRPFVAHVTLARKIERAVPRTRIPAIEWRAVALTLVQSRAGTGDYAVLQSWKLRGK